VLFAESILHTFEGRNLVAHLWREATICHTPSVVMFLRRVTNDEADERAGRDDLDVVLSLHRCNQVGQQRANQDAEDQNPAQ
jgi:hypothetical protein